LNYRASRNEFTHKVCQQNMILL